MVGILDRLINRARITQPQKPVGTRFPFFRRSRAGELVDHDRALTLTAVWDCVRIISESLAALPWQVFSRRADGGRDRQADQTVDELLNFEANSETSAMDFRATLIAHVLLWGNGYAEIDKTRTGRILALWPLAPDRVEPGRLDDGQLAYRVQQATGDIVVLPADRMLHFRGLGFDGIRGYDVITAVGQAMGTALAMDGYAADFFGNGAHPGGVLEHPDKLGEGGEDAIRASILKSTGPGNWLSPFILEQGMKWTSIGLSPEAAQMIESRRFGVAEIARIFRMPLHKLAELDRSTKANIEAQGIEFVTDTLLPWAVRLEQEVNRKLLPRGGRRRLFTKHKFAGLLRGDVKARGDFFSAMLDRGVWSVNEVRALEDQNPIKGGDVHLVPLNMQNIEDAGKAPDTPGVQGEPGTDGVPGQDGEPGVNGADGTDGQRGQHGESGRDGQAYGPAIQRLLRECVQKLCRMEAGTVEAAHKRHEAAEFVTWSEAFYGEHRVHMTDKLWNTVLSLVELAQGREAGKNAKRNLRTVIESFVTVRCMQSLDEIRESSDMAGLIESWRNGRIDADSDQLMRSLAMPLLFGVVADGSSDND
ncbi:hypothetical protein LCGC14_0863900 [marine sediment metagenome]|uniref:Phage portal protein n=1 Tax=marine sediment metagenome TaxID=412755 RepID=A0A0F9RR85_9ZZZZ